MAALNIQASPLPFSNKRIHTSAPAGSSVKEIVDLIIPENLKDCGVGAVVMINGHIVLQHNWKRVRPKVGTLINVRIVPTGGGGGKSPLSTLLSVVVMIAAPQIGMALSSSMGLAGSGIWMGSTFFSAGQIIGAAVGVVGKLLVSALAPPPKPSNTGSVSNPAESPTQFIEGAQNSINPFGVVPINLGTNRMFPPQAGRFFTETQNNEQYVRQLFTYGIGNKVQISDLKIGETPLSEFDGVEIQHRLNGDLSQGTGLYSVDPFQEDFNVLLQQVDGFTVRQTQADVDEAVVDFTFPQGLAQFNSKGKRISFNVQLELQFADATVTPQVWSPAIGSYAAFGGFSQAVSAVTVMTTAQRLISGIAYYIGQRTDIVTIHIYTGEINIIQGTAVNNTIGTPPAAPPTPQNHVRLGSALVLTKRRVSNGVVTTTIESFFDDRSPSLYGTTFQNSSSFVPSNTGTTINVTGGGIAINTLDITAAQAEALRRSQRIVFPTRGTYSIRARRVSADTNSDQILDNVFLTAIKSFTNQAPVTQTNCSGTAIRIKGSNQLSGVLNQFNAVVSSVIPDYDAATDTWVASITSNPASIYRYVLQGVGNSKPLADAKLNLADFAAWHTHCVTQNYTYNRVIDYETSVEEVLRDVAAAGSASPAIVDGKRTIVIDMVKDDIVQIVTPRNSWGYTGEMSYPDLPHAFRVQFRNAAQGYLQDERIVYDDGYTAANATIFETLELQSCTNTDLAFKTARRHIASARLRPETHSFMMDVENLVALRGDRIKLAHDIPISGVGDGRVRAVVMSGGSPDLVTAVTIDDTIAIPSVADFYVRIRLQDGSYLYKQLTTTVGFTTTLTFATPFAMPVNAESPPVDLLNAGDLLYVVEAGGELDLIITKIEPQDDLTARITALDYAPAIFTAESAAIPPWTTFITTPLEFIRPLPPILLTEQGDEGAMIKNSDGSYTQRLILTLDNPNDSSVILQAIVRVSGTDSFTAANVLQSTPEYMVMTGLQDDTRYDIWLYYKRVGGTVVSAPLQINNYLFVGASSIPSDVTDFKIAIAGATAMLTWEVNPEIDIAYYTIKFSNVFFGATWETAQILEEKVYENRLTTPFTGGTYLIKAVDILGNESVTENAIITYDETGILNSVETLVQAPAFTGTHDNTVVSAGALILADTTLDGYYYFAETVDLSDVFISFLSASIVANGIFVNNVFTMVDVFAENDIFGAGGDNDVFAMPDIFLEQDIFGTSSDAWAVELQFRTTNDDPFISPVAWTAWTPFIAGNASFRGIQFRVKLTSLAQDVSPAVTVLTAFIDMPDRIERGDDLTVDATVGATITYSAAFSANPSVGITTQNGATDDKIVFLSKSSSGFSFKVYNQTLAAYVTRTFDYIASGYGRII